MMTQDEIIELAREAGLDIGMWEKLSDDDDVFGYSIDGIHENLEAFAKLVALRYEKKIADLENIICQRHWDVLQEREACANLCDQLESGKYEDGFPAAGMAWECANAIRARGQA